MPLVTCAKESLLRSFTLICNRREFSWARLARLLYEKKPLVKANPTRAIPSAPTRRPKISRRIYEMHARLQFNMPFNFREALLLGMHRWPAIRQAVSPLSSTVHRPAIATFPPGVQSDSLLSPSHQSPCSATNPRWVCWMLRSREP